MLVALVIAQPFANAQEGSLNPAAGMTVSVGESARSNFLQQLEKFATESGFAIDIAPVAPNGAEYRAYLSTTDLAIIAVNTSDVSTFLIFFYEVKPTASGRLKSIVPIFECMLTKVDGISITQRSSIISAKPANQCP